MANIVSTVVPSYSSTLKYLLIFYITLANIYAGKLIPNETAKIFDDNRYIQHILAFITLFIIFSEGLKGTSTPKVILYSVLAYVWFLLTIKMSPIWLMTLLAIITIGYIIERKMSDKQQAINETSDDVISPEEKESSANTVKYVKTGLVSVAFLVTLIGYFMPKGANGAGSDVMQGGSTSKYGSNILEYLFN